jgi:hypothetical protein
MDNAQMSELYNKGMQDDEIGAALSVSDSAVKAWRRLHDLPSNKRGRPIKTHPAVISESAILLHKYIPRKIKTIDFTQIDELYNLGYSDQAIDFALNINSGTTARWRARYGLKPKNKISFEMVKEQKKHMLIALSELEEPQKDNESLFCDTEFLEQFLGKKIAKKKAK